MEGRLHSVCYNSESSPLRYYIAPNANYNLGGDVNFIAFDGLYTARFKRTADTKIALSIDYNIDPDDQRTNDLLETENSAGFPVLGYHNKDYHIYLWALLDQIDAKLVGCSSSVGLGEKSKLKDGFQIYPNPTNGEFSIIFESDKAPSAEIVIYDITGRRMSAHQAAPQVDVRIAVPGVYFVATEYGSKKVVIQ